ncbi:MAG TPA: phosphatase [Candidatus Avisuccinivibrio pullicola]|nr:phosphatase [Candidatus Avisuccinivibrio pullicola]
MRFLVDLHTHTVASTHAYSTLGEYIAYAHETGLQMFATTDHGPSLTDAPHKWHFENLKVVPRVVEDVAILRGVEANITAAGGLDLEDRILDRLDIVLAGFHENVTPTDKVTHTELVLSVIKSGKVDILVHPGSPNYPIDTGAVLECAKEHNVAIELNASSGVHSRLGSHANCVEIARLARKIGNVIALGSDSHIAYYLGQFDEAIKVLEEAELGYSHVLNTSPARVLDFLEARGHAQIRELRDLFLPISY